jgi:sulfide dehydrogenase cytochrome subunit
VKASLHVFLVLLALTASSDARPDAAALARNCAACHGLTGASSGRLIPHIGGQEEGYLRRVLMGFKKGDRPTVFMERLAKGYTEQELASVAAYFARLPWSPPAQVTDPGLVDRGRTLARERCVSCHAESDDAVSEVAPLIAGQWAEYLKEELTKFTGPQMLAPDQGMVQALHGLSGADIEALAHFYASRGGRRP